MAEGLKIIVDADFSQAEKAMDHFARTAQKEGKAAAAAFVGPMNTIPPAVNKAVTSLNKLPGSANAATLSMVNLGRVVQDAPFGFLGIANNLNPLLESFQRLKAQTGSTKTALSALGSSLLGAGGLGFAISIISTGLILFGDKLFGAGKKAKEAASEADKFKEAIKGIFAEVGKEAAQVSVLVGVLQSETETRERRLSAIKELQKIQPEIFAGLKLEGDTIVGLDAAYRNYIKNLSTVIAVKIKQTQLEGLLTKQLEAQGETLTKSMKDAISSINIQKKTFTETGKVIPLLQDVNAKKAQQLKLDKENETVQSDILALIKDISELSKGVKLPSLKDVKTKTKAEIEFVPKFDLKDLDDLLQKELFRKRDLNIRGIIIPEVHVPKSDADKLREQLEKRISKTPLIVEIPLDPEIILNAQKLQAAVNNVNNILQQATVDSISSLADTLGTALAGGDIKKGMEAFVGIVGSALQAIGKELIVISGIAKAVQVSLGALFTNPQLALVAGVALIAAGAALKKSLSKGVTGFAKGGLVFGPTLGLIGEGPGTTKSNPEVIAPLDKLAGMLGGRNQPIIVFQRIRGNDLILSSTRTSKRNAR